MIEFNLFTNLYYFSINTSYKILQNILIICSTNLICIYENTTILHLRQ